MNRILLNRVLKEVIWEGIGWIRVAENRLGCENHNSLLGYPKFGDILTSCATRASQNPFCFVALLGRAEREILVPAYLLN
jgi:hypothetical protein